MIFVNPALGGNETQIEVRLRSGKVALLLTTLTGKKFEPPDSTPRPANAAIKIARPYHAKNESAKSFRSGSERSTQTGTGNIHCGIRRLTPWGKWASSALLP